MVNYCYNSKSDNVWRPVSTPYVKDNLIIVNAMRDFDVKDKKINIFEKSKARDFLIHSQKQWYVAVFDDERDLVKPSNLMTMTLESGHHL